jgi:hypothetical protein
MRHHVPLAAVVAALAAILALAPLVGVPALAASTTPQAAVTADAGSAAATGPKVVIVVGATHEATDSYRSYANQMYAEAIKYTPNVVKVYSPNATWKNVKAAAQGASILIYLGHGSGYPRDDNAVFNPDGHDGMGLNVASNRSDYVVRYYGESYMANEIRLARNAVVILSHLWHPATRCPGTPSRPTPWPSSASTTSPRASFAPGPGRSSPTSGTPGPRTTSAASSRRTSRWARSGRRRRATTTTWWRSRRCGTRPTRR